MSEPPNPPTFSRPDPDDERLGEIQAGLLSTYERALIALYDAAKPTDWLGTGVREGLHIELFATTRFWNARRGDVVQDKDGQQYTITTVRNHRSFDLDKLASSPDDIESI